MSNFATLNPLNKTNNATLKQGNLRLRNDGANDQGVAGNFAIKSGKWYWEVSYASGSDPEFGLMPVNQGHVLPNRATIGSFDASAAAIISNGTTLRTPAWTTGDATGLVAQTSSGTCAVAVDADNGKMWFRKQDGSWQNSGDPVNGTNPQFTFDADWLDQTDGLVIFLMMATGAGRESVLNFGQSNFIHTPPSGFLSINTDKLSEPTISNEAAEKPEDYFAPATYAGTGTTGLSVPTGHASDFVWIKDRQDPNHHVLFDQVRGTNKALSSSPDTTLAEATTNAGTGLISFDSNGFTLGTETSSTGSTNASPAGRPYIAWSWKAGGAPTATNSASAGSVPTSGSIMIDGVASTDALAGSIAATNISANTTSGFSIVTFTSTGSNATVAHGLGSVPDWIVFMRRDTGGNDHLVYHSGIGATQNLRFNNSDLARTQSHFQDTTPTTDVFSILGTTFANESDYVAYCWSGVEGFSKFGSFSGNNSTDGPFINLGFRPGLFVVKCTNTSGSWYAYDTTRANYNPMGASAAPIGWDLNGAEASPDSSWYVDAVSNGIKIRNNSNFDNASNSFVYMAFADSPYKYSAAR